MISLRIFIYFKISLYGIMSFIKQCIIEVYILKYYFESHLIYKWRYYTQTIFNQLNIKVTYVNIIGLSHSVAILWEILVMQHKCYLKELRFHFKRMIITGQVNFGLWTLELYSIFYNQIRMVMVYQGLWRNVSFSLKICIKWMWRIKSDSCLILNM